MTSVALTDIRWASSPTVMLSGINTSRLTGSVGRWKPCCCSGGTISRRSSLLGLAGARLPSATWSSRRMTPWSAAGISSGSDPHRLLRPGLARLLALARALLGLLAGAALFFALGLLLFLPALLFELGLAALLFFLGATPLFLRLLLGIFLAAAILFRAVARLGLRVEGPHLDILLREGLSRRLGVALHFLALGDGAALDVGALAAHLDADRLRRRAGARGRAGARSGLRRSDRLRQLCHRLALERDLARLGGFLRRDLAVAAPQVAKQFHLFVLGNDVAAVGLLDARLVELLEQPVDRDADAGRQLINRYLAHAWALPFTGSRYLPGTTARVRS